MRRSLCTKNQIKNIEMGRPCGTYGDRRGTYRILVTRPAGKRYLSRPRCRWEDNNRMDLQEVGWGIGTGLIWLRIGTDGGGPCECGHEPSVSVKRGEFRDWLRNFQLLRKDSAALTFWRRNYFLILAHPVYKM